MYNSAVFSAAHRKPLAPPNVDAAQVSPPTIRVSPLGSATDAADSRAVLSELTSWKQLADGLKSWALALDTVEVARWMLPSRPPESPPAIRMLPDSDDPNGVGTQVGVAVGVAVAVCVAVAVTVAVAVAVLVGVAVLVLVAVAVAVAVAV